jgi:3-methyladenine DNA glycosylase/8-oxoguanine DNA glycosylase
VSLGSVLNKVNRKRTVAKPAPTTASTKATSTAPSHAHTNDRKKLYVPKRRTELIKSLTNRTPAAAISVRRIKGISYEKIMEFLFSKA